jgi:Lon protease-like protein
VTRLPLFVLPTVLLPGALMPLHVFEPRYRRMMARCLEGDRRFGVLFHDGDDGDDGNDEGFALVEGLVGCVAEIVEFRPLPDGRSLVLCRGTTRFRVVDGIESDAGYAEALVEDYVDAPHLPGDIVERRRAALDGFRALLEQTLAADELPAIELPDADSGDISFHLASLIRADARWHQALLELPTERARLGRIAQLIARDDPG